MPVNTSASYKLLVEWTSNNEVIGSINEVHTFYDWAVELGISAQALTGYMDYYDGSSADQPLWFELVPTVPVGQTFDALTDTPSSKVGKAGQALRVSSDETNVEYYPAGDVKGPNVSAVGRPALFADVTGKVIVQGSAPLGNAAYRNVGSSVGSIAAGDDPRFGLLPEPEVKHLLPYARKSGIGTYDLEYVYGLNWRNGVFKLNQLYQLAEAQVKFAKLFAWYTSVPSGKTNSWVMNMMHGPACNNEAVLQGHVQGNIGEGRVDSTNRILWPPGLFKHNFPSIFDRGHQQGAGTGGSNDGTLGTVFVMDKAGWQGDTSIRNLHHPSTLFGEDLYSWIESGYVDGFRYEGLCNWEAHDPSYQANGIFVYRAGETYVMDKIFSTGFNGHGIATCGSTPIHVRTVSCFGNTLGGFAVLGGALTTTKIDMLSGDDNPCLLRVRDFGVGFTSGGTIEIGEMKLESGKRDPQRGELIVDADSNIGLYNNEGCFLNLTIGNVEFSMTGAYRMDALVAVNGYTSAPQPRGTTSGNRVGRVKIGGFDAHGHNSILHDIDRKRVYRSDGDYVKMGLTWNARLASAGLAMDVPTCDLPAPLTVTTVNAPRRLGITPSATPFNYGTGTPAYDETTVSPIIVPPSNFQAIFAAVNKGIIGMADSAQCAALSIDYELRTMPGASVTWSILSGPANIDGTGLVTPTGTGDVVIKAQGSGGAGYCYLKVT